MNRFENQLHIDTGSGGADLALLAGFSALSLVSVLLLGEPLASAPWPPFALYAPAAAVVMWTLIVGLCLHRLHWPRWRDLRWNSQTYWQARDTDRHWHPVTVTGNFQCRWMVLYTVRLGTPGWRTAHTMTRILWRHREPQRFRQFLGLLQFGPQPGRPSASLNP